MDRREKRLIPVKDSHHPHRGKRAEHILSFAYRFFCCTENSKSSLCLLKMKGVQCAMFYTFIIRTKTH